MILQQADSTKAWRDYVDPEDQTINKYKRLLNKCGIWGSLLGALNATKIARYEGGFHRLHIFTGFSVSFEQISHFDDFIVYSEHFFL